MSDQKPTPAAAATEHAAKLAQLIDRFVDQRDLRSGTHAIRMLTRTGYGPEELLAVVRSRRPDMDLNLFLRAARRVPFTSDHDETLVNLYLSRMLDVLGQLDDTKLALELAASAFAIAYATHAADDPADHATKSELLSVVLTELKQEIEQAILLVTKDRETT